MIPALRVTTRYVPADKSDTIREEFHVVVEMVDMETDPDGEALEVHGELRFHHRQHADRFVEIIALGTQLLEQITALDAAAKERWRRKMN